MNNPTNIVKVVIAGTVILLIYVAVTSRAKKEPSATTKNYPIAKSTDEQPDEEDEYVNKDSINVSYFIDELNSFNYKGYDQKEGVSILSIQQSKYQELSRKSPNDKRLIKAKNILQKNMAKAYPYYRKMMVAVSNDALWEKNIKVRGSGSSITFIGGIFANNGNIKAFQTDIQETLQNFRFKRVNYKWYEQADEYTYYTVTSPKDNEIK
jgi:hypothetical protein